MALAGGHFSREPNRYRISPTSVLHNIIPPLIEIDSSPDEYLFYKEAIIKLKLQPLE